MTALADALASLVAAQDQERESYEHHLAEASTAQHRLGELEALIAQLGPLVNPADVPAGRPVVVPAPAKVEPKAKPARKPAAKAIGEHMCPECGEPKKSKLALSIHRSKSHGVKSSDPSAVRRRGDQPALAAVPDAPAKSFHCERGCGFSSPDSLVCAEHEDDCTYGDPVLDPPAIDHPILKPTSPTIPTVADEKYALRCADCAWAIDIKELMASHKLTKHTLAEHARQPDPDERVPRTAEQVA